MELARFLLKQPSPAWRVGVSLAAIPAFLGLARTSHPELSMLVMGVWALACAGLQDFRAGKAAIETSDSTANAGIDETDAMCDVLGISRSSFQFGQRHASGLGVTGAEARRYAIMYARLLEGQTLVKE